MSNPVTPVTLITLPFDILHEILIAHEDYTDADLLNLRLVHRDLEGFASARLFWNLDISRLRYHRDTFFKLASSPRVLPHVTTVTWLELPDFAPPLYSAWQAKAGNGAHRAYRKRDICRSALSDVFWFPEPDLASRSAANVPWARREEDMKWREEAIAEFLPQFLAATDRMPNLYRVASQPLDMLPDEEIEDTIASYIQSSRQTCGGGFRGDIQMEWLWSGWENLCDQDGPLTNAVQARYIDDYGSTWAEYFDVSTVHSNDGFFTFLLPLMLRRLAPAAIVAGGGGMPWSEAEDDEDEESEDEDSEYEDSEYEDSEYEEIRSREDRHISHLEFRQDLCWHGADVEHLPAHGLSQLDPSVHGEAFSRLTNVDLELDGVRFGPSCPGNIDKLAACLRRATGLEKLDISWRFGGGDTPNLLKRLLSAGVGKDQDGDGDVSIGGTAMPERAELNIWPKMKYFAV